MGCKRLGLSCHHNDKGLLSVDREADRRGTGAQRYFNLLSRLHCYRLSTFPYRRFRSQINNRRSPCPLYRIKLHRSLVRKRECRHRKIGRREEWSHQQNKMTGASNGARLLIVRQPCEHSKPQSIELFLRPTDNRAKPTTIRKECSIEIPTSRVRERRAANYFKKILNDSPFMTIFNLTTFSLQQRKIVVLNISWYTEKLSGFPLDPILSLFNSSSSQYACRSYYLALHLRQNLTNLGVES